MNKLGHFTLLSIALMLAACPDTRNTVSDVIVISPADIAIREDAEQVTLNKGFSGAAFTTFSEATSGLNIDVLETPAQQCSDEALSCENWSFSALSARQGRYNVEAYREIARTDLTTTRPSGTVRVNVFPRDQGSRAVTSIGNESLHTVLDSSGRVWSLFDAPLFQEHQTALAEDYSFGYARMADAGGLPVFTAIETNDIDYGAALTADGRVFHWGRSLAGSATPLSQQPALYAALEPLVQTRGDGVQIISITLPTKTYTTKENTRIVPVTAISGFGAALLSDGTIIAWDLLAEAGEPFQAAPFIVPGIDTAVAISLKNGYLVALLGDGTVAELGRTSRDGTAERIVSSPARVGALQNVVAIAGRRALLADGRVYQWQPTTVPDAVSTPVQISGVNTAVALPDPRQNIAQLADGSLVGWQFDDNGVLPGVPHRIDLGIVGEVAAVAGDSVVDRSCGRVWDASLTGHMVNQTALYQAVPRPLLGFGGASDCDNGELSHVVYFAVTGRGTGTIIPPSGSIDCVDERFGKLCWWFGPIDTPAVFTAVPDASSTLRDWRWDCASGAAQSAPVALRQTGVENSQSLCKVTFDADLQVAPPQRSLSVQVNGAGSVTSTPAGIDCGADCVEDYADGTDVTLTAVAGSGLQFSGWGDTGCTLGMDSATILVSMNSDKSCVANFSAIPGGQTPPVARLTVSPPSAVATGSVVTFDGSASSDADGNIVSWQWDLTGDMLPDASGEIVTFTYQVAGSRTITLAVIDNDGLSAEASAVVDVATPGLSQPPIALFDVQPALSQVLGSEFTFDASMSSDDIGIASWEWDFDRDAVPDASGEVATLTPVATGDYLISLRVTDTDGQVGTMNQTISVTPAPGGSTYALRVLLNGSGRVDINPGAIAFPNSNCDGNECFVFDIAAGTVLTLDATAIMPSVFSGWSAMECDSIPAPNLCIVTVNSNRSVTADFQ